MIRTVVKEYGWSPSAIDGLYYDRIDYKGLLYWFDAAMELIKMRDALRKQKRR